MHLCKVLYFKLEPWAYLPMGMLRPHSISAIDPVLTPTLSISIFVALSTLNNSVNDIISIHTSEIV